MRSSQRVVAVCVLAVLAFAAVATAQDAALVEEAPGLRRLYGQDPQGLERAGIGVGIVVGDKLVFAKGYGYRDYGKKLPFTPKTLYQIASNTKLFTAVAAGLLVDEGKLTWDKPVRESVPSIQFYNDQLNKTVTLRDMLAHRTGITRHDTIWYQSDFSRKELFGAEVPGAARAAADDLPLQQPDVCRRRLPDRAAVRQDLGGVRRERIFRPLEMNTSSFGRRHARSSPTSASPLHGEARHLRALQIPYYEDTAGMAPPAPSSPTSRTCPTG